MKKLTAEQAQWLIENIEKLKHTQSGNLGVNDNYAFTCKEMKAIITQCTEKEFPEFNMETKADDGSDAGILTVKIENTTTTVIKIHDSSQGYITLQENEFKEFIEGCNKIVEWLEEQE